MGENDVFTIYRDNDEYENNYQYKNGIFTICEDDDQAVRNLIGSIPANYPNVKEILFDACIFVNMYDIFEPLKNLKHLQSISFHTVTKGSKENLKINFKPISFITQLTIDCSGQGAPQYDHDHIGIDFSDIPHLTKLITWTNFCKLPEHLYSLSNLEHLEFHEKIDEITIDHFPRLTHLAVSSTRINSNTGHISNLVSLDAPLSLVSNINQFKSLKYLKATDLDEDILCDNFGTGIKLNNLETLDCIMDTFCNDFFQHHHNIKELNLTIKSILPKTNFGSYDKLESLMIKCEYEIPFDLLIKFPNIKHLRLSRYDIDYDICDKVKEDTNGVKLDLSMFDMLEEVICTSYNITDLILPLSIVHLECNNNILKKLDLSRYPLLKYADCSNNSLTNLLLPNNIIKIKCNNNILSHIDVPVSTKLISIDNNKFKDLDLSHTSIEYISCCDNMINQISIPKSVIILNCGNNDIEDLHLIDYQNLSQVLCNNNNIKQLVIQSNSLIKLDCSDNNLDLYDIKNTPSLKVYICNNNNLSNITNFGDINESNIQYLLLNDNNDTYAIELDNFKKSLCGCKYYQRCDNNCSVHSHNTCEIYRVSFHCR